MPRDYLPLAQAIREYIRELDKDAYSRVEKGAWIVASQGTDIFLAKSAQEICLALEKLGLGPVPEKLIDIARKWADSSFYANEYWAENLVKLYEKHH